jgi:hypothetical protein
VIIVLSLSELKDKESGGHAGAGRVKDAGGAAQRGAGVPILSDVKDKPARASALLAAGKIGGTAHPCGGSFPHGTMENPARQISRRDNRKRCAVFSGRIDRWEKAPPRRSATRPCRR